MIGTSARVRALLIAAGALLAAADIASAQAPVPNSPRVEAIRKAGALRVGVLANPPWLTENTRNPQQPWGGPAWTLAVEAAARMGVKVQPIAVSHETKVPVLATNQVDISITALAETPERLKVVDFVSYSNTSVCMFGRANNARFTAAKTVDDLNKAEVTIAYITGGAEETWVPQRFPAAKTRGAVNTGSPAPIEEIMAGRADAAPINRIQWLAGIINGTGNFILTEMREKGRAFAEVLREAQALGYAEADPTFDIEGIDAAHKLTILASIAFGIPLQFSKTYTEGISRLTQEDIRYADELGYRIKHLGISRKTPAGIELRVHPTLLAADSIIANVNGVMNAVMVNGDAVGSTLYYGAGAGAGPTASAVVADIIDVARMISHPESGVPSLAFRDDALSDAPILPMSDVVSAYYLRISAADRPGVLADITEILGDRGISIQAIIQKEPRGGDAEHRRVPVIILTREIREAVMDEAITRIEALDAVSDRVMRIRVFKLDQ